MQQYPSDVNLPDSVLAAFGALLDRIESLELELLKRRKKK